MITRFGAAAALLMLGSGALSEGAINSTPFSARLAVFQPCAFDMGDYSVPAKTLAATQNYDYVEYTNTIGARPAGALPATIENFVGLSDAGIIHLITHGGDDGILVECYPTAAQDQMMAKFNDLINGRIVFGPMAVTLKEGEDIDIDFTSEQVDAGNGKTVSRIRSWGISLTKAGIRKIFNGFPHTIILNASCSGFALRDAFMTSPLVEYLGYAEPCNAFPAHDDAWSFFNRLRGIALSGHARAVGAEGPSCTAFGYGGYTRGLTHAGPGNTTVAPAIDWIGATPAAACKNGFPDVDPESLSFVTPISFYQGHVGFDTRMDTYKNPAAVVTADGCDVTMSDQVWTNVGRIDFNLSMAQGGTGNLRLVTHSVGQAVSLANDRELDGNLNPFSRPGVAPNKDDYVAMSTCIPSLVDDPPNRVSQLSVYEAFVETLSLSVTETPVGSPGLPTTGIGQISSTGALAGVELQISALVSGPNTLPPGATLVTPLMFDLEADVSMVISIHVEIPSGQPAGTYSGTLTASDGGANTVAAPFSVVVANPPIILATQTATVVAGYTVAIPIWTGGADGHRVALSADMMPEGAVLTDNGDGTGLLTFTPPRPGMKLITIHAFDPSIQGGPPIFAKRTIEVNVRPSTRSGGVWPGGKVYSLP